jgi:hypothetical protein
MDDAISLTRSRAQARHDQAPSRSGYEALTLVVDGRSLRTPGFPS